MSAAAALFAADLANMTAAFRKFGAVVTTEDGFAYVDESKVPATFERDPERLVRAYRGLIQYGHANGFL